MCLSVSISACVITGISYVFSFPLHFSKVCVDHFNDEIGPPLSSFVSLQDHVWHGVEVMQLGDIWNTVSKVRAPHSLLLNREGLALALPRRKDPIFCCPHSAIRRVSSQDKHLVVEFGTSASCGEGRLFLLPPSGESTAEYIFRMINSQQRRYEEQQSDV
eukprot:scpid83140/ scgid4918/ 